MSTMLSCRISESVWDTHYGFGWGSNLGCTSTMFFCPSNSADLDEMPHIADFHLGHLCLLKYPFMGFPSAKRLANPTEINIICHFMHFYLMKCFEQINIC